MAFNFQSSESPLWRPDGETVEQSHLHRVMGRLGFNSYEALYQWSIDSPSEFWGFVVEELSIRFKHAPRLAVELGNDVKNVTWLPEARLNIAESCFQAPRESPAIVHNLPNGQIDAISLGALSDHVRGVAHGLTRLGLQPGDQVAVFMPMNVRSVAIYLGIVLAGCVVVSIADSFAAEALRSRLEISQAKVIFTVAQFVRDQRRIALFDRLLAADGPRAILADDIQSFQVQLREFDLNWDDFIGDPASATVHYDCPQALINVLFSSGTTGQPKAIAWDHTTPVKAASDAHFHQDLHPRDIAAWPTNLGWMMGPWLIFATLINRGTIALFNGAPIGRDFGQFVQDAKVNMLGVVPAMVAKWRRTACMAGLDWSSIRLFSSTGECSQPADMHYLSSLAGGKPIIEYCGGTELGGGYIASTVIQENYASRFSTPALGSALVLLDESGKPADEGEAFLVPPAVGMSQDLLHGNHNAIYYDGVPLGPEGEILRRHGDRFRKDAGGYFRALGRADDAMNLGGIKVSAAEIEHVLMEGGDSQELAAIAVAPAGGGPARLIICLGSAAEPTADVEEIRLEMQQTLKRRLNALLKIHEVRIMKGLPRTASNKIMRRELRAACGQEPA